MPPKLIYQQIPTNLVIGFLGVGKTTAIRHLLAQRPKGARWAVLLNELGETTLDSAALATEGVTVREIPVGCLCCVGSQSLAVGLNRVIREVNPERILIEPSGLGHPSQLAQALSSGFYRNVLDLRATVCLLDARKLSDPAYRQLPSFQDQLQLADVLVANKRDTYAESDRAAFLALAAADNSGVSASAMVEQAQIPLAWLDLPHPERVTYGRVLRDLTARV